MLHSAKQTVVHMVEIDPDTIVRSVDKALLEAASSKMLSLMRPVLVRSIVYRPNISLRNIPYVLLLILFVDWSPHRLVRATACRLVQEEDMVRLYYSTENTREFKEVEEQFLEVGVGWRRGETHLCPARDAGPAGETKERKRGLLQMENVEPAQ